MATKTVEVHAEVRTAAPEGPSAVMAYVSRGHARGLFAFGASVHAACEALAGHVATASASTRPVAPARPARIWVDVAHVHEAADAQRSVSLPAVTVRSPAGGWMATVLPHPSAPTGQVADLVGTSVDRPGAIANLAELLAEAYRSGTVAAAPAEPTRVVLIYPHPITGKVHPGRSDRRAER
jgi:hypothetical protein